MSKIVAIVSKNLKLVLRSRVSALIIIFGPLFLTLLVGMAFNNKSAASIQIGTYSPDYNPLVNSFLDKITESKLGLIKFDSEQKCADSIKRGVVNLCLVFPPNFEIPKDNNPGANNVITFYVDPSQINLVDNVKGIISTQLENRTQELSTDLITVLLTTLDNSRRTVLGESPAFSDITTANENVQAQEDSIKSKLGSLDLTFNRNLFGADALVDASNAITTNLQGHNGSVVLKLNQSLGLCDGIKTYPDYNTSSFKSDLDSLCSKVRTTFIDISGIDESTLNELNQAISSLQTQLDSTSKKFSNLQSSRNDILAVNLKEMSTSSDTILNRLMTIKSDMDSIQKDIDSIQVKESSNIVSPIRTAIKPIVSDTYLNYMFPSLIALVVMLVSLLFAQTMVMMEKKSSAYFRNMVTPTKEGLFIFSNFLTTFLLILLQTFLILVVSTLVFKVDILTNLLASLVSLLIIITLFTIVGIIIGLSFSTQETSTLAAVSFGSIALFISDVILPLESMPEYIRNIAKFNPFVLSEYLLRSTIVFNTPLLEVLKEPYSDLMSVIFLLLIYVAIFIGLLVLINRFANKTHVVIKPAVKNPVKKGKDINTNGCYVEPENTDAVKKVEDLIDTALQEIKNKEFDKARIIYLHLNELYVLLPMQNKKAYFKKINRIHEELEKLDRKKR